jgi:hypothetical protein
MAVKYPNGHKIYEHLPLQDPSKLAQIRIFGLKIYHLATLVNTSQISKSPQGDRWKSPTT